MADPSYLKMLEMINIDPGRSIGVRMPDVRSLAKRIGKDHSLAEELWNTGVTETMILAALVDVPVEVTEEQMESWVSDIRDWGVCDQTMGILFRKTSFAYQKAKEWVHRDEEFVKRAGLVLMASLAVHDKEAPDGTFQEFLILAEKEADDTRKYVMKAVNWVVRQVGKRSIGLNVLAIASAERINGKDTPSARWIASDALRELRSEKVAERLANRS